jgi:hypothetical protein
VFADRIARDQAARVRAHIEKLRAEAAEWFDENTVEDHLSTYDDHPPRWVE